LGKLVCVTDAALDDLVEADAFGSHALLESFPTLPPVVRRPAFEIAGKFEGKIFCQSIKILVRPVIPLLLNSGGAKLGIG
jgi:hypothetical protein